MSGNATSSHFLPHLTSPEIARLPKERGVVVLPLASVEQHGPHLPVYTDTIILETVLERTLALVPADFPVWTLPVLAYGKSNEHARFPGTITLTSETLIRVLKDIGRSVSRSGFRRFAILNAHGGNTEIVDFVIRDIREETGLQVFALHLFLRIAQASAGLTDAEKVYGIHAGDQETSMLLHACPELVRKELAPDSLPSDLERQEHPPFMGPLTFAWLTEDLTETGVLGDATVADPQKGERFLSDAAKETAALLHEIVDFEFP